MKPWRSKKYRDAGKGHPCTFNCGRPAVEGAHIRLKGFCGTGQKPPDVMLVDCCRECHQSRGNMNRVDPIGVDELSEYAKQCAGNLEDFFAYWNTDTYKDDGLEVEHVVEDVRALCSAVSKFIDAPEVLAALCRTLVRRADEGWMDGDRD